MTADALARALPGWEIRYYPRIDSTNAAAMRWLEAEAPQQPALVCAQEQTAGRGRFSRRWETPAAGAVALSLILRVSDAGRIPMAAGVATVEAVERLTSARAGLKWPNDVELDERKIAGILVERARSNGLEYHILGIGINVSVDFTAVGGNLARRAGSICDFRAPGGAPVDLVDLVSGVGRGVQAALSDPQLHNRWKRRLTTLGRRVTVGGSGGEVAGVATDVDTDGCLLVVDDAGRTHRVSAGDVTVLKSGFSGDR